MSIHYYSCINDSPHTLIMELNMQAYSTNSIVFVTRPKNDQSFSISSLQPG